MLSKDAREVGLLEFQRTPLSDGRAYYPKIELDAWAQNKIGPLVRSTAEIAA